ncbi:MAG: L-fuculose kinase [Halioglobus sp.]|nr:L-fuculose kinase [Halioglobus sp.]
MHEVTAILDVGKTNVKLCLLDASGKTVSSLSRPNDVTQSGPYPHFAIEAIWSWLLEGLAAVADEFDIRAINISTHGACAVLVDGDGALALPVLDYEYDQVESCDEHYDAVRPAFERSFSPALPAGLNLGRQLFWLSRQFPADFAQAVQVFMYPQYWAWRLSGVAATEATSLGCHTDLWYPGEDAYSPLVEQLDIRRRLPPLVPATAALGRVTGEVAESTGLPQDCLVYAGVHDSNASFARHLAAGLSEPFTAVSTGTWVIAMAAGSPLAVLDEHRDTLANVSVHGKPLACARFMGGREFEEICRLTNARLNDDCEENDIAAIVSARDFCLPAFASAGGPFARRPGELPRDIANGKALATLYLALMIDYELDLLQAQGDIVFGSAAGKNPLLCRLLAQLRPGQRVLQSGDDASTVRGAWCLTRPGYPNVTGMDEFELAPPTGLVGFDAYRDEWRVQSLAV